jgi:phage-related protein
MYTATLEGSVYVLDVFQKKAKSGRATPQANLDRIEMRLKAARKLHLDSSKGSMG